MRKTLAIITVLVALTGTAQAQVSGSVEFNLFEMEGASANRIFLFDQGYEDQNDIPVPTPFSLAVPMQDQIELIADGQPDGGAFARFTFATGDPRVFVENIQIITATLPFLPEQDDPDSARLDMSVAVLRDRIFPVAVQGFDDPEILAIEIYDFDGYSGVHLIGRYTDPAIGPMLLRLTAHPNPDQPQSYLTVANINLALVPVTDGETLRASLSSRVANSLNYLSE